MGYAFFPGNPSGRGPCVVVTPVPLRRDGSVAIENAEVCVVVLAHGAVATVSDPQPGGKYRIATPEEVIRASRGADGADKPITIDGWPVEVVPVAPVEAAPEAPPADEPSPVAPAVPTRSRKKAVPQ
jgi:hypothetical protein